MILENLQRAFTTKMFTPKDDFRIVGVSRVNMAGVNHCYYSAKENGVNAVLRCINPKNGQCIRSESVYFSSEEIFNKGTDFLDSYFNDKGFICSVAGYVSPELVWGVNFIPDKGIHLFRDNPEKPLLSIDDQGMNGSEVINEINTYMKPFKDNDDYVVFDDFGCYKKSQLGNVIDRSNKGFVLIKDKYNKTLLWYPLMAAENVEDAISFIYSSSGIDYDGNLNSNDFMENE